MAKTKTVELKFRITETDEGEFKVHTHDGGEGFFAGSWSAHSTHATVEAAAEACGEEMLYLWEHRDEDED